MSTGQILMPPPDPALSVRVRKLLFGANPKITLIRVLVWGGACLVFFRLCFLPIKVSGWSMFPTYSDRAVTFVNRMVYWNQLPERGDIVAVKSRNGQGLLLKRVVGLPGETISIRRGNILVDGAALSEDYIHSRIPWRVPEAVTLKTNQFFIIGDNRRISVFGIVERDQILGKVFF